MSRGVSPAGRGNDELCQPVDLEPIIHVPQDVVAQRRAFLIDRRHTNTGPRHHMDDRAARRPVKAVPEQWLVRHFIGVGLVKDHRGVTALPDPSSECFPPVHALYRAMRRKGLDERLPARDPGWSNDDCQGHVISLSRVLALTVTAGELGFIHS